jgi:hypothetical protein
MTKGTRSRAGSPPPPKPSPRAPQGKPGFAWPTLRELLDTRRPFLIPAVVLVVSRLVLARFIPYAAEDAYITFRYARNLAHGVGLVFNPEQRVFGFSSPLWTMWVALGFKLGALPVPWTRLTTIGMELVTLVTVVAMLRRYATNTAAWCFAFFFVAWPYFSAVSVSGMENPSMVGLIALTAAWCARRSLWAGPGLGALVLMRPEGLAPALVLAVIASWRDRLMGAAIATAGLVGLTLYFGSPIPQSMLAKSAIYGTPGPWAGRYWWDWLTPFVFGRFTPVTDAGHLFLLSIAMAPAIVLGVRALWPERRSPLAGFVAACLAVWLGYALLGVAFFYWYLVIPLAGFAALAAVGFPSLARGRALYVSFAALTIGLWTIVPQLYLGRAQNEWLGFAQVAKYLAGHARPGEKVMLEPIGMIGYQAPLIVVDEVGLVSPQVVERRLKGPGWYADLAASERPDWLVIRRGVFRGQSFAGAGAPFRNLAERDALSARYALAAQIDTTSGDYALLILRRIQ